MEKKTVKYLLLLILTFELNSAFCQKNLVGINIGSTFFGSGDFLGYNTSIRYERVLFTHLSIFSQIGISTGQKQFPSSILNNPYTFSFWSNNSRKINFGLCYNIFNFNRHSININPSFSGIASNKFKTGAYYLSDYINPPLEFKYIFLPSQYIKSTSFGFGLGFDYRLKLKQNWIIGLDANYQRYRSLDVETSLSIITSYLF